MLKMDLSCNTCGQVGRKMKRCTRCSGVLYCSRNCQVKDWSNHKTKCTEIKKIGVQGSPEKSIFPEENYGATGNNSASYIASRIDFQKAFDDLSPRIDAQIIEERKSEETCYLLHNMQCFDAPVVDTDKPTVDIKVRAHKTVVIIKLQESWNPKETFKYLSHALQIPLDKLVLIHKGKKAVEENIKNFVSNKAVFQAIGEKTEDDSGVHQGDIDIIMKQLPGQVERNEVVKALKQTGDVVDAILLLTSK